MELWNRLFGAGNKKPPSSASSVPPPLRIPERPETQSPNDSLLRAIYDRNTQLLQAAIEKGADVAGVSKGRVPLLESIERDFPEGVSILLEHGADQHNPYGNKTIDLFENNYSYSGTALWYSMSLYKATIPRLLLSRGAKVDAIGTYCNQPYTPLARLVCDHAGGKCNPDICQVLIDAGANVNWKNSYGSTILHSAVTFRGNNEWNKSTIEWLVMGGADVNAEDDEGCNVVCRATFSRDSTGLPYPYPTLDCIRLLMNLGADPGRKSKDGRSAKDGAKRLWREFDTLHTGLASSPMDDNDRKRLTEISDICKLLGA